MILYILATSMLYTKLKITMSTAMKYFMAAVFLFLICADFTAQVTFSQRFDWSSSTLASNIWTEEDGYTCSGIYTDTIGDADAALFIRKVNLTGQVALEKFYSRDEWDIYNYEDAGCTLSNGQHALATYLVQNNIDYCLVWWFDQQWDTIRTVKYESIYGQNEWIYPLYSTSDSEDNLYVATQVAQDGLDHFMITKISIDGNIQWQYLFETVLEPEICSCLYPAEDGVIVASGGITGLNNDPVDEHFFKLSTTEENEPFVEWDIEPIAASTGLIYEVIVRDSEIIAAASYSETGWTGLVPSVYSINYSGQILWETPASTEFYPQFRMHHLVETMDGGYIGATQKIDEVDPPTPEDGSENQNVFLARYNSVGDLIWTRKYSFLSSTNDRHEINDLKACDDGGFIFCGEATDTEEDEFGNNIDTIPQRGWLVKIDSCGCLVPGCSQLCNTLSGDDLSDNANPDYPHFIIGPNPAIHDLNIYFYNIPGQELSDATIRIHDLSGKEIRSFRAGKSSTTYILDLSDFSSGEYVISLISNGHPLQNEKISIAKH
jgi:Secretion system C-terminal sorting domain